MKTTNLEVRIKWECDKKDHKEYIKETEKRLINLIKDKIGSLEGLFHTWYNPFANTYYFSVRDVKIKKK